MVVVVPRAVLVAPVPVIAVPVRRVALVVHGLRRRDVLRRRRDPLSGGRRADGEYGGERTGPPTGSRSSSIALPYDGSLVPHLPDAACWSLRRSCRWSASLVR